MPRHSHCRTGHRPLDPIQLCPVLCYHLHLSPVLPEADCPQFLLQIACYRCTFFLSPTDEAAIQRLCVVFSVAVPHAWNRLLRELKLTRSPTTFKRHLNISTQHTSLTDYGMRHRANCSRRITDDAVIVSVPDLTVPATGR